MIRLSGILTLVWFVLVLLVGAAARALPGAPVLSYVSQQGGNNWHIYLADTRRSVHINLTRGLFAGSARSRLPTWAPGGETLAFVSDGGGSSHVYLYDMRTRQHRRLTDESHIYSSLSWSPDGAQLAVSATAATPAGVRLIDVATGAVRRIQPGTAQYAELSPDGARVLFLDESGDFPKVMIADLATSAEHCLAPCTAFTGRVTEPHWSPDGQYIAYTSVAIPNSPKTLSIARADADIYALTVTLRSDHYVWSPDGARIAFSSGEALQIVANVAEAFGEHFAPEITTLVQTDPTGHIADIAWSPDGNTIALAMDNAQHPLPEIFVVDVTSGRLRRLTANTQNDWSPAWKP